MESPSEPGVTKEKNGLLFLDELAGKSPERDKKNAKAVFELWKESRSDLGISFHTIATMEECREMYLKMDPLKKFFQDYNDTLDAYSHYTEKALLAAVRHGKTTYNIEGRATGGLDVPLDEEGEDQMKSVGEDLKASHFDIIFPSPLVRSLSSTEIIGKELESEMNIPVVPDRRLSERRKGVLEGRKRKFIKDQYRDIDRSFTECPAGGENSTFVLLRMMSFFRDFMKFSMAFCDKYGHMPSALIVSHNGPLRLEQALLHPKASYEHPDDIFKNHSIEGRRLVHRSEECNPHYPQALLQAISGVAEDDAIAEAICKNVENMFENASEENVRRAKEEVDGKYEEWLKKKSV